MEKIHFLRHNFQLVTLKQRFDLLISMEIHISHDEFIQQHNSLIQKDNA